MNNEITAIQEKCFQMILCAGDAKALFSEAIQASINGDKNSSDRLYQEGVEKLNEAHSHEASMIASYGQNPTAVPADLLLIHANDHLSMALSMQELCNQSLPIIDTVCELNKTVSELIG